MKLESADRPTAMGESMKLSVATCQFPVDADIHRNLRYVLHQLRTARERGADVVHFPEACLSGYAGSDIESTEALDWDLLHGSTERVLDMACHLGLWVILGSTHRLTEPHKPHNSLYIIDDRGRLVDRYDKRFCAGDPDGQTGDLAHYSPGDHFAVFSINGIRCGTLICYDYRFPELYRAYKREGVEVIFHSFHAAHASAERVREHGEYIGAKHVRLSGGSTLPAITMPATMIAAAAANHVWISCSNSSARLSSWPSFFVRADGVITGRLRLHTASVLISAVDTKADLYEPTPAWRERAMSGILHSGTLVRDKRSEERTHL